MHRALTLASWFLTTATLCASEAVVTPQRPSPTIIFPAMAGLINVRDHGAKGDGVTDDTAALLGATTAAKHGDDANDNIVYLPAGTYLISDTIGYDRLTNLRGENRERTIIQLIDRCPGFTDAAKPKPLISACPGVRRSARSEEMKTGPEGNCSGIAFCVDIHDLTVRTGVGNPGAIGIDWLAHNQGTLQRVDIISGDRAGVTGLDLTRKWIGPALVKDVSITGFDRAVDITNDHQCIAFEHLWLSGQRIEGLRNMSNGVFLRGLHSVNTVPVIRQVVDPWGMSTGLITVIEADLIGGDPTQSAIINTAQSDVFLRDVHTTGYSSAVAGHEGADLSEWASKPVLSTFPAAKPLTSFRLPVQETPFWHSNNPADWANVMDFGADPLDDRDDAPAIQKAIESGKAIVYFPPVPKGQYLIGSTVHVHGGVRKLAGMRSVLVAMKNLKNQDVPLLRVEDTLAETVFIEDFKGFTQQWGMPGPLFLEHASPKTLVVTRTLVGGITAGYRNTAACGPVFFEDVCLDNWHLLFPQTMWARQINPEGYKESKLINHGGAVWIMGWKSENPGTEVETRAGGITEVLGGFIYDNRSPAEYLGTGMPRFINDNSRFCISYITITHSGAYYDPVVKEVRNGVVKILSKDAVYPRNTDWMKLSERVPMYVGTP